LEVVAGRDIILEGEAEVQQSVFYAHRHLFIQGKSRSEGTFLCGGNFFVRNEAVVEGMSLLIRAGGRPLILRRRFALWKGLRFQGLF
jgi:hypothetical protein